MSASPHERIASRPEIDDTDIPDATGTDSHCARPSSAGIDDGFAVLGAHRARNEARRFYPTNLRTTREASEPHDRALDRLAEGAFS